MAGKICDQGISALNVLLGSTMTGSGYVVALFTNNHTPALSDTLGSYTEATFGGYARQGLDFNADEGVVSNIDTIDFSPVSFVPTGSGLPETCYGYFMTDGSVLIGAELFPVPIVVSTAGVGITLTPTLSYQDRSVA
jgi:hypothetical protein